MPQPSRDSGSAARLRVLLVGHPNCGKTTLFNALTGLKQSVGNWSGVTVTGTRGTLTHRGRTIDLIDLPGTYALTGERPQDEQATAAAVAARDYDLIVNIVDAAAPERSLYLTAQILESQAVPSGVPVVIALNRTDRAAAAGLTIDPAALALALGCPVVPLVATRGDGLRDLCDAVIGSRGAAPPPFPLYPRDLVGRLGSGSDRWAAITRLENAPAGAESDDGTVLALGAARHAFIAKVAASAVRRHSPARTSLSDRIDRVALHPWFGVPVFLGAVYLMFLWTIHVGGAFVDAVDGVAGALLVDGLGQALAAAGAPPWLILGLADGLGRGVQTIATFIPIIACLYLFLSSLEQSGYMARAAVVMDRFMRRIGLPGKAFVPLIVGLGCNVPAVMATRTLEEDEDRLATIAMTPFMSCGARLPVYVLFAAAIFPATGQNLVFVLYLTGIAVAVLTGFLLKKTLFSGAAPPLVIELPAYQAPAPGPVLRRTWDRVTAFVIDAGRVIVPVVMVLSVLNAVTADGRIVREGADTTLLAGIGRAATPLFAPMGIAEDNWPATVGLFTGVFAKEAVVGTLNALYTAETGEDTTPADVPAAVAEALATIPANLGALGQAMLDPLGLDIGDPRDLAATAAAQEVNAATFGVLRSKFDGAAGAFAYLVFILLYAPCVATVAAMRREAGRGWTLFVLGWSTGMGYLVATLTYQAATFARHPAASALWIAGLSAAFALVVLALRRTGASPRWKAALATLPAGCPGSIACGKKGGCH